MNEWALITGASQGIGAEFARWFAARNYNLILIARDEARLRQLAAELTARHGIQAKVLAKDLSCIAAAPEVFTELQAAHIEVSVLINNAGFGQAGPFAQGELQKQLDLVQVNITTLAQLTHLFVKPMLARRQGRILNVASIAAFQPGPFMAMYYASKSFVLSFSCALARELAGSGVTVTALCPGLTRSEFHARAGMKRAAPFLFMNADAVADIGGRALLAGKPLVVAGLLNRLGASFAKALPIRFTSWIAEKVNR
jgi:short-subunit dehydrogenase